jgi:hypothetical protein
MRKFWMVMADVAESNGDQSAAYLPRYRHPSELSANHEAERLARAHPGCAFIVLEVKRGVKKADVQWSEAE